MAHFAPGELVLGRNGFQVVSFWGVSPQGKSARVSSLDKYILRQCLTPLALILVVTTAIVWMTQTLQRVDIIVEYGQGLAVFAFLSLLIIPSLLAIIIPFALFGATVYALFRLHSDSEIAAMFAAGVSRRQIAGPILLITIFGALVTFYVNVDLMPRSYRVLKQEVANIRANVASSVLRSGEFTNIIDGFTIYIDEVRPGGQFVGLLVNDHRKGDNPETYMAERAIIQETDNGAVLLLKRGNIQRVARYTGKVSIVRFEEWAVNLAAFEDRPRELQLELTERYLGELFNPDMSKPYDQANAGKLIAEGHARIAAPIYAFAYVLVGLYALIGGPYNRRSYFLRVSIAGSAIFFIRVLGYVAQGLVESSAAYWTLYAIPGSVVLVVGALLFAPASAAKPIIAEGAA